MNVDTSFPTGKYQTLSDYQTNCYYYTFSMIKFIQIHIGEANFLHPFVHSSFICPEIFTRCSLYVSVVLHPVSGGGDKYTVALCHLC